MTCRYCGQEIRSAGSFLTSNFGQQCNASPNKKHIAVSDGVHCVYCGKETRATSGGLVTYFGQNCSASPNNKHMLQ